MATQDEENAWAVLLQSLAVVVVNFFDQAAPEDRTRGLFLAALDGYIGEMLDHPPGQPPAVRERVLALRALLNGEIEKVMLLHLPENRPH